MSKLLNSIELFKMYEAAGGDRMQTIWCGRGANQRPTAPNAVRSNKPTYRDRLPQLKLPFEPVHEKTNNLGFRTDPT